MLRIKKVKFLSLIGGIVLVSICACSSKESASGSTDTSLLTKLMPEGKLRFESGIGYYWSAEGVTHFLYWTKNPGRRIDESSILAVPPGVRFFSYGLDMSRAQASMLGTSIQGPPHMIGYGFHYRTASGQRVPEGSASWAVRFVPVKGYDEKVYEIIPDGPIYQLASGEIDHQYFALDFPQDQAYIFRFITAGAEERRKEREEVLFGALSDSAKRYPGSLSSQTLAFTAQEHKFEIQFSKFESDTGAVEAIVTSGNEKLELEGYLVSLSRLVLKESKTGVEWDLISTYDYTFTGTYSRGLATVFVVIELKREEGDDGAG